MKGDYLYEEQSKHYLVILHDKSICIIFDFGEGKPVVLVSATGKISEIHVFKAWRCFVFGMAQHDSINWKGQLRLWMGRGTPEVK